MKPSSKTASIEIDGVKRRVLQANLTLPKIQQIYLIKNNQTLADYKVGYYYQDQFITVATPEDLEVMKLDQSNVLRLYLQTPKMKKNTADKKGSPQIDTAVQELIKKQKEACISSITSLLTNSQAQFRIQQLDFARVVKRNAEKLIDFIKGETLRLNEIDK